MSATASTNGTAAALDPEPPAPPAPAAPPPAASTMLVKLKRVPSPLITLMTGSFRTKRLMSTRFFNSGISATLTRRSATRTNGSVP